MATPPWEAPAAPLRPRRANKKLSFGEFFQYRRSLSRDKVIDLIGGPFMLKSLVVAVVVAAVPFTATRAVLAGSTTLPVPYYYSSFESAQEDRSFVSLHYANGVYPGPVSVVDPFLKMSLGGAPTPFISVSAHGGADYVSATGGGNIEYYFAISGPNPVVVPLSAHVIITSSVRENVRANGSAGGEVDIQTDQGSVSRSADATLGGSTAVPDAHVDEWVSFSATADTTYLDSITISGSATGGSSLLASITSKVFVDPYLVIDPTWARTHPGYSLSFSPGIDNSGSVGGVPEPATWALLVAGFGLVGGLGRRDRANVGAVARRRRAATVAAKAAAARTTG